MKFLIKFQYILSRVFDVRKERKNIRNLICDVQDTLTTSVKIRLIKESDRTFYLQPKTKMNIRFLFNFDRNRNRNFWINLTETNDF